ncbi:hypothetical protein [Arthrobacter sp. zg-Y877]|uniref:hypothetical protein n=1 Tax=Arthrobacter sp. zg-Y877 TaxID=3049074 RepID=UPI0025A38945|nr:hypothetical protein [Arthrobacter sp. zg-Y877]MDM7990083.1 hypothetical protein [Arthrobacter sp. zg-Y877]
MENTHPHASSPASRPSLRRPAAVRIRTAAAGSFLAAASAAGMGVLGAAPARAAITPVSSTVDCSPASPVEADRTEGMRKRLAGIHADLVNAVKWGSVTQAQADRFYAQLQDRMARGL